MARKSYRGATLGSLPDEPSPLEQPGVICRLKITSGQGYLLAAPGPEPSAKRIDMNALVAGHEARRRSFLNGCDLLD
jgi:hypothetical protein